MNYLKEISQTLHIISKGNLKVQLPIRTTDEIGELARTVNGMAYQLNRFIEEEKRWEKAKTDLVTNMSHDLRTPLTSILGYLELIQNKKYKDEQTCEQYIHIAYQKSQNLKVLIDELFEYSKINHSDLIINATDIHLSELIDQVLLEFIPAFEASDMEYRRFFAKEKIVIRADAMLMVRVLENLIANAIHYGQSGKYVDIKLENERDEAVIQVISYGEIIQEAELPFIFERFYRVDSSRSKKTGGSGLGLAIVKSIIKRHGGSVQAFCKEKQTIFEVRLKHE